MNKGLSSAGTQHENETNKTVEKQDNRSVLCGQTVPKHQDNRRGNRPNNVFDPL